MNTFYKHLQPNIIKFSDNEELPENLKCHYIINYNVWGIDYFYSNYLLQESDNGAYLILKEDSFNILLEDAINGQETLDLPRLYILITDKFMNDSKLFEDFIFQANKENSIYANGIPGFRPGEDYFLNSTLYNYLVLSNLVADPNLDYRLPNYLDYNGNITKYFVDLNDEPIKDYTNLNYFNKKNQLVDNTYSEDQLNNFYQTFCSLILSNSTIQNNSIIFNKQKNQIYNKVLNYYLNNQVDDTSVSLELILGSNYTTYTQNYSTGCGCSSTQNSSGISEPCTSLYAQAMNLYLKQMLGDIEFYEDWFTILLDDEDDVIPNDILIESLILFIKEFESIDYNLDFNYNKIYNCDCVSDVALNNSSFEYKKLNNFIQILNWVNNLEINSNTNKIKVYGEAFAELLLKLQF